ncbi:MAG: EFR1 family ferrodoxin [Prolixibacteraceae bacterium]|jgi:Pyruvate/2-oxoacid:ferredoxin oxidoreductase delta subunit/menaquinone-dependent protoporphyrinogen IX oxidase|nr:EFR1 family ferrodoxin [Prolixibacteraceae bacterium]
MYTIIYFSPTGNAKHLTKKLANNLKPSEVTMFPLEFTDLKKLDKNKHLVLIHAIHGFNAPRTVKRFVRNLPEKKFEMVSLLAVGCSDIWVNDAVSLDLRKKLQRKGYSIALDEVIAMPLTFVMNFPDELNLKLIAEAEKKIEYIAQSLLDQKVSKRIVKTKSKIINFLGKVESPAARLFGLELHANKNCDSCSICWTNCPEKNIQPNKNGKPKYGFSCSMCMRCIYNCPQKAISPRISKFIPIKNGYSLLKYLKEK